MQRKPCAVFLAHPVYSLSLVCFLFAGVYSFCFDNGMSRFSSKVVYFYLLSYIPGDWDKYEAEVLELQGEIKNFTASCIFCK